MDNRSIWRFVAIEFAVNERRMVISSQVSVPGWLRHIPRFIIHILQNVTFSEKYNYLNNKALRKVLYERIQQSSVRR